MSGIDCCLYGSPVCRKLGRDSCSIECQEDNRKWYAQKYRDPLDRELVKQITELIEKVLGAPISGL